MRAKNTPTCNKCGSQSLIFQADAKFDIDTCDWEHVLTDLGKLPWCKPCDKNVDWYWADINPVAFSEIFPKQSDQGKV